MSEEIICDRRHFLGTAAMTIAAAQFGMIVTKENVEPREKESTGRE